MLLSNSDLLSRVYHTINRKTIPDAKKAGYHRHGDTLPLFFTNGSDLHCSCPVPPNRGGANGAPAGGAFLVDIPTEAVAEVRGPDELRLLIFPQPFGRALKNQNAAPASPPCFRRRRRSAPLLFESTLGYALKSFGQKKNSSIFTTLEFLVERSNPNPNHCPLRHLWRRFHRK